MSVTKRKCGKNAAADIFRAIRNRYQVQEGGGLVAYLCRLSTFKHLPRVSSAPCCNVY